MQYKCQLISIHLMLLFNVSRLLDWQIQQISIHLMLLFNYRPYSCKRQNIIISIHLMLLFNRTATSRIKADKDISIHLMLLFNVQLLNMCHRHMYFNTSNVTIQRGCKPLVTPFNPFQYI